jgi:fibronectin type 3 domain-containing protein
VTFIPTAAGATTSTLTFISNALNSPTTQAVTGTGQTAVSHSVDLSWTVATGAVSYDVYRKLVTDSNYTKIGSADVSATYSDGTVTAGQTYDYVVTTVDAEQQESGYSNIAQVTVPTS